MRTARFFFRPPGIHVDLMLILLKAIDDPALKTESVPNRLFHRRSEPPWDVVLVIIPLEGR
ncbi:hypothetical protein TR75_00385 [Hydrogenibacillus schlegelii]|uniref:Uncharacterized protein n=1 Tax=Hydrogenibacillus schlegelii TaxID=1484 RepID=A0A132NF60_HYDSH|nr:hypothetical protein TR75_00385 [Hydrogenibacillus schlegelii]OAR04409.1 hypothetical protein SA87_02005 [Hydrogenibacillus schlegelii]